MGLLEYALTEALLRVVDHVDRSEIIVNTAKQLEKLADQKLGVTGSQKVQERLVIEVFLPICRELMNEDLHRFHTILESEQHGNFGSPQRGVSRGTTREIIEDRSGSVTRQEAQSSNIMPKVRRRSTDNG